MATLEPERPDPERLLWQMRERERENCRGRLKVFLGYSSGVGKSFRMLDEGRRRAMRGQDIVVGAIQPKTSGDAEAVLDRLERIPMLRIGDALVMDTASIRRRHPETLLVDGLAYDNPPGARWPHRWQEIDELLADGISVIGTVNLQFIGERREAVERITGRHVTQTIPLAFLRKADEIELVDAPPDLGASGGVAGAELEARRHRLLELRELALLLAADVVDRQLESYLHAHGISPLWGTQERILVCIIPDVNAAPLIESGHRNAERFRGELIVAYVRQPDIGPEESRRLEEYVRLARSLGAEVAMLDGEDSVATLLTFARSRGITQIFVGHSLHTTWWKRFGGSKLERLIDAAVGIDVRVFPH